MSSSDQHHGNGSMRTYHRAESAVFLKTKDDFGGLSNMAGGYPLKVNGEPIRTSEALYQACRFPHKPELQDLIIQEKSPMSAKMKSKPHRPESRSDWDEVRVKVMRWCLEVKLAQHWDAFGELLLSTGERPIVEHSRRDDFWGARPVGGDGDMLVGVNALGRLLMELRGRVVWERPESLLRVPPLNIPDFLLYGEKIAEINATPHRPAPAPAPPVKETAEPAPDPAGSQQLPMAMPETIVALPSGNATIQAHERTAHPPHKFSGCSS